MQDDLTDKAHTLSSNLRLGRNKIIMVKQMIKDAIGKRCKYCNEKMNMNNICIDHKVPKAHGGLDDYSNLEIICATCNGIKSDFTDKEFEALVEWLSNRPELKHKLFKRLKVSHLIYR